MDIKDFFPSVNSQKIRPVLREFFPDEAELELTMQLVTRNGRLPQGAPTSPHLANLVFSHIDEAIARSLGARWVYSRYADDLAFSGDDSAGMLIDTVSEIALRNGFSIATKKTRVMRQHHRQKITGLVVNRGLNLPREKRKNWRATLHRISTQGVEAAEPHCPFKLNGFAAFHMGLDKFKKAQA
jgi:RNA-directed DNA polymerase